jgi:hypothetical protein
MIDIALIEENLDKINSVYSFICLLEVHYSMSKSKLLNDIKKSKDHLKTAITSLAYDIDDRINHGPKAENQIPLIITETKDCLEALHSFVNEKEFKNAEVLEKDINEFLSFLKIYSNSEELDIMAKNKYDLKALRSKLLFILS